MFCILCCGFSAAAQDSEPVKSGRPHIARYETKPENKVFIPKGTVMIGGFAGYNSITGDNINFLILKNLNNVGGYYLSATPYLGGFVADNIAFGGRFGYNRYMANLGNLDLNLGEDMNIGLKDLYAISHKYEASLFTRFYIPFGNSRIVAMFAEIRLNGARTQGKNTTGSGYSLDGTFIEGYSAGISVNPGLCVFMCDFVAAELGIGILGADYTWKKSVTNQVETGYIKSFGVDYKLDLLSINIGISFYF